MSYLITIIIALFLYTTPAHAYLMDAQQESNFNSLSKELLSYVSKKDSPAENAYKKAIELLVKNKFDDAYKAFEKSISLDKKFVKGYLGLAEIKFKQNKIDEAKPFLVQALDAVGPNAEVYGSLARYYYIKKDFNQSAVYFRKTIKLNPTSPEARVDLGDLYMNAFKQPLKAIPFYKTALSLNPRLAGTHYALALALNRSGGPMDKVVMHLKEANRLEPTNPLPLYQLATVYQQQQKVDLAIAQLTKVIKLQPKFMKAYVERGDLYLTKGKTDKSLSDYLNAMRINTQNAAVYTKLGMVYQVRNELNNAKQAYEKAIQLDPKEPFAYNNLAWLIHEQKGDGQQAIALSLKAVELAPNVADFLDTLGWLYFNNKDNAKALEVLLKANQLSQANPSILYHLAVVYQQDGNRQQAVELLQKAVALKNFPELADAQARLNQLISQ